MSEKESKLQREFDSLMEVHIKTLRNEYNLTDKCEAQRREIVGFLRKQEEYLEKIIDVDDVDSIWENITTEREKWEGKK